MKRFHVHLRVNDLTESIRFYQALFNVEPTVVKGDYAKWMLDDPRVNFALSTHGSKPGIDHLGVQAEAEGEFEALRARLRDSSHDVFEQDDVTCC